MNAIELLDDFRRRCSEDAFGELVHRYTNLVYSAAKRRLGGELLAQDAAQAVFIRLSRNPPLLSREAELTGWLHRTTVYVSIDLWRSEARRRAREEHAVAMQAIPNEDRSWAEMGPSLDEALDQLTDSDRDVILLRFFDHKSMRELGDALGISDDAAKMRVSRAVARLRDQLGAAGVTCSMAAVGAFLAERAVEAAPAGVAAAIAAASYPMPGALIPAMTGAASVGIGVPFAKIAAALATVGLIGLTVWVVQHRQPPAPTVTATGPMNAPARSSLATTTASADAQSPDAGASEKRPDPVKLLQAVARARQRLASGAMEFQVDTFGATFQTTNRLRVTALFEGSRQRFEQFGREYAYTYDPDPAGQDEIRKKADAYGFDKDGAIRAGLLSGFEAHYTTVHDGQSLMKYREKDGKAEGATVDDPSKGGVEFVFDPRCLGLSSSLYVQATVEGCLGRDAMGSAQLVGQEPVDGFPAWHVRVPAGYPLNLWLDASDPFRVLKTEDGSAVCLSRYDSSARGNPIPKEVTITHLRNGVRESETHLVQMSCRFNIVVEPSTFTLEGLGMKVGTSVIDVRNLRQIGYWTGTGLSHDLTPKTAEKTAESPKDAPTLDGMLAIIDNMDPASDMAFDAAQWILLNTPDGPAVDKAARLVLENHLGRPDLAPLCQQMERMRHRATADFLAAVWKENPQPEVQATACFALATLRMDESKYGEDKKTAAEAEALFERVINQFKQAGPNAVDRCSKAKEALSEMRRMSVGKLAPDFEGTDLPGRPVRLSALRGKVVAVVFWYASNPGGPEESLMVLAPFAERGLVCLSIYCDDDRGRATPVLEKYPPAGPVIWDGNHGPIAAAWQVHGWPSVFVLDRTGVIRARNARGPALAGAVTKLLNE